VVTDIGSSAIIRVGFCYSSNVTTPSLSDNVIDAELSSDNSFTTSLSGLNSGTTYYIRAFATNSAGTTYGAGINLQTDNQAPILSNIQISGTSEVNKTLRTTYTYTDAEGDAEGATTFQWYMADDATGTGETIIDGATVDTFLVKDAQDGKFLRVAITPKAVTGTITGIEVKSNFTTAIGAETVTFLYNGVSVVYGTIISTATQKKWLDRNLGAGRVAQSVDDYEAYGDLFQWGRPADGHQLVNHANTTSAGASGVTGIISALSNIDAPNTNKFIINPDGTSNYDWRSTLNNNLWQGSDGGINNPCPSGWRIATKTEWEAEGIATVYDGYDKLKLTFTGYRSPTDGAIKSVPTFGAYWTSSVNPPLSINTNLLKTSISIGDQNRGNGQACRCIKQ
jgi:hypothetical protein